MLYKKRMIKFIARILLCTMTIELVNPAVSSALTSGPSQPEVQSFEPVGTTDMVDMFSGDFVYNIPLMDVEGYPINISYHGGADMEQEASWVGLGWNINPGVINRTIRGLPDDMNGDIITKKLNIKPEKNIRVGVGGGVELAGVGKPLIKLSADLGVAVNMSNYKGVSADVTLAAGVNVAGMVSAGVNLGVGSQSGADVDMNAGVHFSTSQIVSSDVAAGVGFNIGSGYSSRTGLKDLSMKFSASLTTKNGTGASIGTSAVVPIGVKNIVPVVTNKSEMTIYRGQLKLGGELFWGFIHGHVQGMLSTLTYDKDGSMPGYGYLYAQNGTDKSIMDFTRDRDGMFNEKMSFLPLGNMTYDVYSVSGQGTGGSFRPFRNDFGSVYDPAVTSEAKDRSVEIEAGLGNLFSIGCDISVSNTDINSGPWHAYQRPFTSKQPGSLYENTYFKQAGEVTETNPGLMSAIQGVNPIDGVKSVDIPIKKPGSETMRDARGNLIYYFTADEATKYGVASSQNIYNYTSTDGFASGTNNIRTTVSRTSNGRKGTQLSEIVQVQTDGRRYIYGLPAMNTSQDEVTMAVSNTPGSNNGLVTYTDAENSEGNSSGRDNFYSRTSTPAFAHSYLLTDVLSTDYVDVSGDGPTDDDFGSFTKFNYSLKNAAYQWKAPYGDHVAQFNEGFKSDTRDNKANVLTGTREQWLVHSIETKNFVAEFYTSARDDGRGVTSSDLSYKLDSIKLFNKHDRLINATAAIPVKTVIFQYDYSLCPGVPNNVNGGGKLTLKKIYVRYGNSDRSMISPYQFSYGNNPAYNFGKRDRWGGYKSTGTVSNADYPYVDQNNAAVNTDAAAWSLETITLPSGGNIHLEYEADDYAYVMDKAAMEMFSIAGLGSSTTFSGGNQLYQDKNSPKLYLYFNRRPASENSNLSPKDNYLKNSNLLYYNANTRLVNNSYEPIKGYAKVQSVGYCSDGTHGYVKLEPVDIKGGGASINHISYTAINFGRYYLPHIIFPGSDPEKSNISNVLAGLKYAFTELVTIAENPVKRMTEEGKAKQIDLATSFIRLNSPGLRKKGGGQRVKKIEFADNWSDLAGGNAQNASYGKTYDYTTEDQGSYGTISSGVASYEPQIGGDENPFRSPVDYVAQSGGTIPPHDPVGLYQEMPVGESLYPGASVGYSKVTVKSIHQGQGRSSQGVDIYEFYTAKDFPVQAITTSLNPLTTEDSYSLTKQKRVFEGSQGYTLIFNDMHGKPKRTEHRIIKPSTGLSELVSYKQYNYFTNNGKLSNEVPVVAYDPATQKMKRQTKTLGIEADITVDTREKTEETKSKTIYANLNVSLVGIFPIPVPFGYYYWFNFKNEFRSVVATKVIQQYGILKEVQSSEEGAVTTVRNEAFDPVSGQALITSVNNEYNDKEYSVNYPAYWGYKSMGPSYQNTGYEENFPLVQVVNHAAVIPVNAMANYKVGDEVYMTYGGGATNAWVTSMYIESPSSTVTPFKCTAPWCLGLSAANLHIVDTIDLSTLNSVQLSIFIPTSCTENLFLRSECGNQRLILKPRYKSVFPQTGTLTDVRLKIVRSGAKNQLNESIQSYTGMSVPFDNNGYMKDNLDSLIGISAREYSDTLTAILPKYDSLKNPASWDSLNTYVNGTRQIKRVSKEYTYIKNRDYIGNSQRNAGLFSAKALWQMGTYTEGCIFNGYKYCAVDTIVIPNGTPYPGGAYGNPVPGFYADLTQNQLYILKMPDLSPPNYSMEYNHLVPHPTDDRNWVTARTVTKYSPWGFELENKDAIGNYTAAMYGYNQQLPVALAQNARQHEVLFDGFEEYNQLQMSTNYVRFSSLMDIYSFLTAPLGSVSNSSQYGKYSTNAGQSSNLDATFSHTGKYSLKTGGSGFTINLNTSSNPVGQGQPRYLKFTMQNGERYIVSYWIRPASPSGVNYNAPSGTSLKSRIIDNWQQVEGIITVPSNVTSYSLLLPANTYVDDIRVYPYSANMKAFVYHPVNQKLVATLDENNYASFYEYDQEGNLVRTKKETDKGIITVMESRSANVGAK
jgi:hypothetical protein